MHCYVLAPRTPCAVLLTAGNAVSVTQRDLELIFEYVELTTCMTGVVQPAGVWRFHEHASAAAWA